MVVRKTIEQKECPPFLIRKKWRPVRHFLHFSRGKCGLKRARSPLQNSKKWIRHFFEANSPCPINRTKAVAAQTVPPRRGGKERERMYPGVKAPGVQQQCQFWPQPDWQQWSAGAMR